MDNQELDEFINNILDEKRLSGVTDEVRAQLLVDMRERLLDQVNRALIEAMPDNKVDMLNTMLANESSDDDIQRFIEESGVNVSEITTSTMIRFRNLYIGATSSP